MPRPAAEALALTASQPSLDPSLPHDPANDVTQVHVAREPVPTYTLTPTLRSRFTQRALTLTHAPSRLPTHMNQRFDWVGAIQGCAWRDRASLVGLSFGGEPLTHDEIDEFGDLLEFAREVFAQRGLMHEAPPGPADPDPATMTDAAIADECRTHQRVLCDPLGRRFRKSQEPADTLRKKREAVRTVVRSRGVGSVTSNNAALLALCEDPAITAWLATLRKGESHALARLRALHPEWVRRGKQGETEVADLPQRAWAMVMVIAARVLEAGRYLTKGVPARAKDYRGFVPRTARKPTRKTGGEDAAPPVTPAPQPPAERAPTSPPR